METNIETHLALRHDAWRPTVSESSGDSPLLDTTEREVALEALHSKLHDSAACGHLPTVDDSKADPNWVDQRHPARRRSKTWSDEAGASCSRGQRHSAEGEMPASPDRLKDFSEDDLFQWVNQNPSEAAEGPNIVIMFMRARCTQELITRGWAVADLVARTGRTTDEITDLAAGRWDGTGA